MGVGVVEKKVPVTVAVETGAAVVEVKAPVVDDGGKFGEVVEVGEDIIPAEVVETEVDVEVAVAV